ncbi:hypothetical protein [Chlorogloea sp. CCALA 695]|uniref:hypothetical protein n=1 Tax=Chlorogloea sp. CCALA 695 TaxID=2107693 RepID=UPI000D07EE18|nr:hypothetical protein [Chlorogloea sp. CCALA 695]PSB24691.1 hypothetical protein C7B70_25340 [Chlorogloea sp. CCALA 695]
MSNQQRINDLASLFGDKDKIIISLGREKIYPNEDVSDATLERLENALRSPQLENKTIRVLELIGVSTKTELIYRSSQNALDLDPKNVAKQFQTNSLFSLPKIEQVEQSLTVNQWLVALNQTVKDTVKRVEEESLYIP